MSMFTKATKAQAKARVAFAGPTGSGKTWTSLVWAKVLGARVAVIDTERGSASLYAPHFEFDTLTMSPPYEPARLVEALKAAEGEGYDVVVIDSLSHFWEGEGGTLDIADAAGQRAQGNSFAGWKVATPELRHLVDMLLGIDCHVIATMRSKMEYVLEEDSRGKKVPRKIGMAPVMRAGVEYEFTMVGDLDLEHRLTFSKSRCDVLADSMVQAGRAAEAAETFRVWLDDGAPMATRNEIDAVRARINSLDEQGKTKLRELVDADGLPPTARMLATQVARYLELIASCENKTSPATPSDEGASTVGTPAETPPDGDAPGSDAGGGTPGSPPADGPKKPNRYAQALHIFGAEVAKAVELDAGKLVDLAVREATQGKSTSANTIDRFSKDVAVNLLGLIRDGERHVVIRFVDGEETYVLEGEAVAS